MALEHSDLNDGAILQQTRQIQDDKGHIQFAFKLPSGRDLKSEFMRKEDARTGIKKWLEVVKEQAVADSNAERLERAAKSRRGNTDLERRPGDDQPLFRAGGARGPIDPATGTELPIPAKAVPGPVVPMDTSPVLEYRAASPDVDPLDFAIQQRNIYAEKVDALRTAEKKFKQWQTIVFALEEQE
jgi:hypothetical protein